MWAEVKDLLRHRELLASWTFRDIRVRYKQPLLGAAWAIVQPLSATVIFTLVFSRFVPVATGDLPHILFYYAALLPWTFFAGAVTFGMTSLVNNMRLVGTISFPREIIPLSAILVALVDFLIASLVFVVMLVFYRLSPTVAYAWLPLIFLVQLALMASIVLFTSAVTVFYHDVRFAVPLILQLWMYLSPVIYPVTAVPKAFRLLYMVNPMAAVIDAYRRVMLQGVPPRTNGLFVAGSVALLLLLSAYRYFKRAEGVFADMV